VIDILISGGPVMIPLGLLSLVALAIVLERLWVLRRRNFLNPAEVTTLSQLLSQRQFDDAVGYCRRHQGPFSSLVMALVDNRSAPYDELREILEDTGRHQLRTLQRGLPALSTIVSGAPLLGLLGTVLGMIRIFSAVASEGTNISQELAGGIGVALITTATGLVIAIPALFAHAYLEHKAVSVLADIESQLVDFLHLVRRPRAVEPSAAAPPAEGRRVGAVGEE
jgi:biopolymer transport protein ExbB